MRGALRAGAKVILDQAKATAPVGPPSSKGKKLYGGYAGALRDSIRVGTRIKGGTVTAYVRAGGKNAKTKADVFYANMIEFGGTKSYTIAAFKKGGFLSLGGVFRKTVPHPALRKIPFMRPALDGQAQNAVIAAAEYMKNRLATKEGLDTADILVEGDEP
mgnify:CR=1 FL=1